MDGTDLQPGDQFAGFTITDRIAVGGMSVLYRAVDPTLGRTVALKVMATNLSADDTFRHRFLSECRAASAIDHPNVIPLYSAGEHEGRLYLTMRFVPGGSDLRKFLRERRILDPATAIGLLGQAAAALDAVHASGMVHRDVKPENLLLATSSGAMPHVYLTDFGISRGGSDTSVTEPGSIVGTLAYAAPEQITSTPVSPQTDVYAMACVAFECLTGTRPFNPTNEAALLYAHLHDTPPSISQINPALPPSLDSAVSQGLAKQPSDRPDSATALIGAMAAALGMPIVTPAVPPVTGELAVVDLLPLDDMSTIVTPPGQAAISTPSSITRADPAGVGAGGAGADGADGAADDTGPRGPGSSGASLSESGVVAGVGTGAASAGGVDGPESTVDPSAGGPDDGRPSRSKLLVMAALVAVTVIVIASTALASRNRSSTVTSELVSTGGSEPRGQSTDPSAAPEGGGNGDPGTSVDAGTTGSDPSVPGTGVDTSALTGGGGLNPTTSNNSSTSSANRGGDGGGGGGNSTTTNTTTRGGGGGDNTTTTPTAAPTFPPSGPITVAVRISAQTSPCDTAPDPVAITLSWGAPASTGGSPVLGYRIKVRTEGDLSGPGHSADLTANGNETSKVINVPGETPNLKNGEWNYTYEVVAYNAKGDSTAVRATSVMPDFVGRGTCQYAYWRESRGVGLRGVYEFGEEQPSNCSQDRGKVFNQNANPGFSQYPAGTKVKARVYLYC